MVGALYPPTGIRLDQQVGIAALVGEGGAEDELSKWFWTIPRVRLEVGLGVGVRVTDGVDEFPCVCCERAEGLDDEGLVAEVESLLLDDVVVSSVLLGGVLVGGVASFRSPAVPPPARS